MRKIFYLFALVSFQFGFSQEPTVAVPVDGDTKSEILNASSVEKKPEYPGGIGEFYKHVANHFNVPTHKDFKGGKVMVSFVVERDGTLTDIKVLRDAGFGSAEEAIRVLKISKIWQPAEQNGKKVRCHYMLPITLMSAQ